LAGTIRLNADLVQPCRGWLLGRRFQPEKCLNRHVHIHFLAFPQRNGSLWCNPQAGLPVLAALIRASRSEEAKALVAACNENNFDSKSVSAETFFPMNRNCACDVNLEPARTIPLWEGERMDEGMAVEGLLQLEWCGLPA